MQLLSLKSDHRIYTNGEGVRMGHTGVGVAGSRIFHLSTLRAKAQRWRVSTYLLCRTSPRGRADHWIRRKKNIRFSKAMNIESSCKGCGLLIEGREKIDGGGDSAQRLHCPGCGKETFVFDFRTTVLAPDVTGKKHKYPKHRGAWSA